MLTKLGVCVRCVVVKSQLENNVFMCCVVLWYSIFFFKNVVTFV